MNHVRNEELVRYINDELDEHKREQIDQHIYSCDQCLNIYMRTIEEHKKILPEIRNQDTFTEKVIRIIANDPLPNKKENPFQRKIYFYQKAAFHYLVAAAMTIILMTSGVFTHLMSYVSEFETTKKQESSVVEGLMNNTVSLIDRVQKKSEEELSNEK